MESKLLKQKAKEFDAKLTKHPMSSEELRDVLCQFVESLNEDKKLNGWVDVKDSLPKPLQTVWLTNGKGWVCLGCLIEDAEGWHWAESNGVIYIENGEIVSECESEDLDVNYWHELPKL